MLIAYPVYNTSRDISKPRLESIASKICAPRAKLFPPFEIVSQDSCRKRNVSPDFRKGINGRDGYVDPADSLDSLEKFSTRQRRVEIRGG